MKKEFSAKVIINSPAKRVWQVISKSENFPKFDPTCIRIEGEIEQGKNIKIYSKLSPKQAFKVRVTKLDPDSEMVWQGGMPFELFRGVRLFKIIAKDDFTTEVIIHEKFSGLLSFLICRFLPDMTDTFKKCIHGLKKYIESGS